MNRYHSIINFAQTYSYLVDVQKSQHFCFIFKGGNLCAWASNKRIQHWEGKFSLHAEEGALRWLQDNTRTSKNHGKYSLVSIRVNKLKQLRNAKPCGPCQALIRLAGIMKVYYSTDEGIIVKL